MTSAVIKVAVALSCAFAVTGCVSIHDHRGAVLDQELVSAVKVGVDNKQSVEKTLGSPTFVGEFTNNDWYYVARDTRTFAFRNPRVTDQTVLHIRFDQAGNVAAVDRTGEELVAKIDPVDAQTPTAGRKRSLFDDIFGNIGAVNSAGLPGGGQGPY